MLVILGDQLFATKHLPSAREGSVFMAEDAGLCTCEKHHRQGSDLFLAAMRAYADEPRAAGYDVHYAPLVHFEIEDNVMETYVDSSGWVMGPDVYGEGLFSDGGVFATKPHICGSNFLVKIGDYSKGA